MSTTTELQQTIDNTRGILAADESSPTIAKRFAAIKVESTEENRRHYRSVLVLRSSSTSGLGSLVLIEMAAGMYFSASSIVERFSRAITNSFVTVRYNLVACCFAFLILAVCNDLRSSFCRLGKRSRRNNGVTTLK